MAVLNEGSTVGGKQIETIEGAQEKVDLVAKIIEEHTNITNENAHSVSNIQGLEGVLEKIKSELNQTINNIRSDSSKPFSVEVRNDDPDNAELGRMWIRSDL